MNNTCKLQTAINFSLLFNIFSFLFPSSSSSAFLLYIKCDAMKEGDSGRAKVVLDLYAAENGVLGENVTTVELIFLKDCASFCWIQDDDDSGDRQLGRQCNKYRRHLKLREVCMYKCVHVQIIRILLILHVLRVSVVTAVN